MALLASINFLVGSDGPPHAVWDESYYLTSAQRYHETTAQFATHPPLGLMLIAAGDALVGANRSIDVSILARDKQIGGEDLPAGFSFRGARSVSGAFAVLGALAFFAMMLVLTEELVPALLFSNLYTFENAFIAHFRAAQLDAFQIAFMAGALLCFAVALRSRARSSTLVELALGVFCGLALMVKASAALFVLLPAMLAVHRVRLRWQRGTRLRALTTAARDSGIAALGLALAVAAVFAIHVAVSSSPPAADTPAGRIDSRFVSAKYGAYLEGHDTLSPAVLLAAAHDYVRYMAADFAGMARADDNGSHPLQWPLHRGTINYRWDSYGYRTAYVQLAGNPVGWTIALAMPIAAAGLLLPWPRRAGTPSSWRRDAMGMLLLTYVAVLGAHVYLETRRVMYLYHYFPALLLAFSLAPLVFADAAARWPGLRAHRTAILLAVAALHLGAFLFFSPLSFHRPLTRAECESRNFMQHVITCEGD